ncbi:hypothetical protein Tco_0979809 [Tanacetum coccineum]
MALHIVIYTSRPIRSQIIIYLEKVILKLDGPQIPTNSLEFHDYSDLNLDNLEELEMRQFKNLARVGICETYHGEVTNAKESTDRA